ncbi:MAG: hypothetical protein HWN68_07825 [Desulfobacterales bacterium]|nr:hypothetical protein [Desulfobacterales bacterium]
MLHKKNISRIQCPRLLALFEKRIDGDDALMHLAGLRFKEAGLGTEFYAETPMVADWLLRFKPTSETPVVVHLHRGINLFDEGSRKLIMDFAKGFKDQVFGLVIHDQAEIATRFDDYLAALRNLESALRQIEGGPCLFIEYAVGLEPELFIELFMAIRDLERISGCVDIGHIGLWGARTAYSRSHPGKDVCALTPHDPQLPEVIEDVQGAVRFALDVVLHVIQALGHLGKPLHFHLHDAHPLSTFSSFGLSDHLSFLTEIPLPFEYEGVRSLHPMFGPLGLSRIVTESLQVLGPDHVSFSLEIHSTEGRLPLGNASYLFGHWEDKGNAERMNYWLSVLLRNHELVSEACEKSLVNRTDRAAESSLTAQTGSG